MVPKLYGASCSVAFVIFAFNEFVQENKRSRLSRGAAPQHSDQATRTLILRSASQRLNGKTQ